MKKKLFDFLSSQFLLLDLERIPTTVNVQVSQLTHTRLILVCPIQWMQETIVGQLLKKHSIIIMVINKVINCLIIVDLFLNQKMILPTWYIASKEPIRPLWFKYGIFKFK